MTTGASPSQPATTTGIRFSRPQGRVMSTVTAPPVLSAAEAVTTVATSFGVTARILHSPTQTVALIFAGEPAEKRVVKLADALGLPLIAAQQNGIVTGITELTLTSSALIAGPSSAVLQAELNHLGLADAEGRITVINRLEQMADERLEAVYAHRMVRDDNAMVRGESAAALHSAQRPASYTALVRALQDTDPWVVDNARVAIQQIGAAQMEKPLRALLASQQVEARLEAADLLERIFGLSLPEDFWDEAARDSKE